MGWEGLGRKCLGKLLGGNLWVTSPPYPPDDAKKAIWGAGIGAATLPECV
jgi:hypothetical protein